MEVFSRTEGPAQVEGHEEFNRWSLWPELRVGGRGEEGERLQRSQGQVSGGELDQGKF